MDNLFVYEYVVPFGVLVGTVAAIMIMPPS